MTNELSKEGTGERGFWVYREGTFTKVDRIPKMTHVNVAHGYIPDEMPPTRNPLNPREIFTSKSKLRERYREAGAEEIGTAYDNGYRPEKIREERTKEFENKLHESFKRNLNK